MADRKWNYGTRRGLKRKQTLADSQNQGQSSLGSSYNSSRPPSKDTPMSERATGNPYRPVDDGRRRQSGRRKRSY